jgi:hypothetical protein
VDAKTYLLIDLLMTENGRPETETPQGIFKLLERHKREVEFTWRWQDLRTNKVTGTIFYSSSHQGHQTSPASCLLPGCLRIATQKSQTLINEIENNFSSSKKGSDVLILSLAGSLDQISGSMESEVLFNDKVSYHERWRLLNERNQKTSPPQTLVPSKIRLGPIENFQGERILVDSRRPVAGNGDTASSLFLIQNLLRRGFKNSIDILVDDRSENILRTLSKNLPGFGSHIRMIHSHELRPQPYTLVVRSGLPSGRIFDVDLHRVEPGTSPLAGKINVTEQTIFFSLTIYGNTENRASVQPLSLVVEDKKAYLLPSTGLSLNRSEDTRVNLESAGHDLDFKESGIFRDPFSLAIRDWSLSTTENFLLKQTESLNRDLHDLMAAVIQARKVEGIKYSLAYGFSIPQVRRQARDYFRSLLAQPSSHLVLTPSAFNDSLLKTFTEVERQKIRLISLKEFIESGKRLPQGLLTVVQIPNVPHQIFASLLLASHRNRVVPLGAGDGFFTTALSLGIPFVPTIVEWNIRNVRALSRLLQLEAFKQSLEFPQMQNLRRIYSAIPSEPIDLTISQQLLRYERLFRGLISRVPDLIETLDTSIGHLRKLKSSPPKGRPVDYSPSLLSRPSEPIGSTDQQIPKEAPYSDFTAGQNPYRDSHNSYRGGILCRSLFQ